MRFRYLVAVPFEDHGSEALSEVSADSDSVRVTPDCRLGPMDFVILRRAFELLPTLIGLPEASFSLSEDGVIEYSGFPAHEAFVAAALDPATLARIELERYEQLTGVYTALRGLASALETAGKKGVEAEVRRFAGAVMPALPLMLFSSQCDEPLLRGADSILAKGSYVSSLELRHALYRSPWSLAWAAAGSELSERKRIQAAESRDYYVAERACPLDCLRGMSSRLVDLMRRSSDFGRDQRNYLLAAHRVLQMSEELHYLWGSVATTLSCAAARIGDARFLECFGREDGS